MFYKNTYDNVYSIVIFRGLKVSLSDNLKHIKVILKHIHTSFNINIIIQ